MNHNIKRTILLLACLALAACGNKVAVQHPDNKPLFNYPAKEEKTQTQFPVTIDEERISK